MTNATTTTTTTMTTVVPLCPLCSVYGIETQTAEIDRDSERYAEIDAGCTEPVCGMLCDACAREMARAEIAERIADAAVWTDGRVLACDEHRRTSDELGGGRAWREIAKTKAPSKRSVS